MISAQLSLFDVAQTVATSYKIGARVKLKKKTPHAPLLKKGDIVTIEAIHPHNGCCKFWSELTESWGYLYPDEFVLLPPELDDSVSKSNAQIADTEYTVPPAELDDSVSKSNAQIADTEYTVPPAELDDSVSKAISSYTPRGTACCGEYFRFSDREGSRMRHVHIRGGNTGSPMAIAKVQEVRSLLAAGIPPAEVAAILRNSAGKAAIPSCD
ncbi:MAG: hypothetical protein ICV80_05345 [Microcoleus sp. T1-bin1]|nr:hypothetical protein [Microcoleus sp. T1-bin1]MBD0339409.1 hypothetical protein [Microcoleus sp. Co-bin12]